MRFANLLPPAAIIAGTLCLLAAAHGAVPLHPPGEVPCIALVATGGQANGVATR